MACCGLAHGNALDIPMLAATSNRHQSSDDPFKSIMEADGRLGGSNEIVTISRSPRSEPVPRLSHRAAAA